VGATLLRRFIGQAQAGEALEVGLFEVQMAKRGEVEGERRRGTLGPGQRVKDGQAHVGYGDLREDRAIDVLDQRMDGGLRMHGDPDLGRRHVEKAAGFDDLQSFVEHGGGVDGDAAAHDPGGMLEGLLGVMCSNWLSGVWRKGPPEAVSQIVFTSL